VATDVGSAVGYLDLDISGFLSGLQSAQSQANTASKNIATTIGNNLQSAGKSMTSAGSTLTKTVTTPVLGLGTAAVKVTSDFESAMSKVSAISGATGGDLDALNKKAQEMGAKTKFSATESAEAFTYMAMAGWKTEDMLNGIDGIMSLAAADGLDLATTSDIVTDALTAFGLSASDSGHFADVLAKASSNANTNVSMLGESFKYAAPVAGALGYSAEDTAIALGLMANAGIKGSQGGTALRGSLTRLIKPTDEAAVLMEQYGLSMTNADGSMKSLGEVMNMLRDKLGGLTEAEQAQVAAQIFGQEAMSGMLAIINASDSDYAKLTDAIYDADGAAQQMADTMLDNLSGQLTLLKSALEGLAIQFGEILMPYIKQFVTWLQNLTQKLQELTPEQKEQIVKWAAIAAAIGPVLMVLGKLTSSVGSIITTFGKIPGAIAKAKSAFTAVSAAIGGISAPVVAVVAVIGVLIAAFANLWKTNEEFRNKMTAIWDGIKSKFESFAQGIVDRLNALGFDFENFGEVVKAIWDGFCSLLAPIFEGVFNQVSVILGSVLDALTGIFDVFIGIFTGNWDQAWQGVKEIFGAVWDLIKGTFESWAMAFKGIADTVLGWFGTTWDETWANIKQFFVDTWNGITTFFSNVINAIKTAVSNFIMTIINFFAQLPTNIANFITNAYNSVVTWVSNMVAKAREMGQNFLNAVVSFFTNLPYKVGYFIGNTLTNIVLWVGNMVAKAREMGTNFINNVVSFFTQLPGKVLQFITSAFNNVQTWATNMVNKAREMGTNFINNVVSFFTQLPGKVLQFITSALNNVQTWATNMVNKAREMGTNFINNVVSFMQQLPGKIKQYLDSAINNLKTWVTQMGQKGTEAVQSLINNVMSAASGIASKVMSIGTDIVTGVWNGIKNAAGWFTDQVKSFFSGIVDGVKDALGIGSPSKVFRDEIGRWLPPGVVQGFEAAMPSAMKAIQKDLNKGIDNIDTDDISVGAGITVSGFADKLKSIYNEVALWFESIESRIGNSVDSMMQSLDMLIRAGQVIVNSDGTLGYIGYNGFTKSGSSEGYVDRTNPKDKDTGGNGDTFIFNSPKAIDEIEAAKQMKKTKQDMAEGF
jgi:TP901 family phage tail tape measure protein